MTELEPSKRIVELAAAVAPFLEFFNLPHLERRLLPGVSDFLFGNPHDPVPDGYVEARQRAMVPQDKDWFAYKLNEKKATAVVARTLTDRRGRKFSPSQILMTNGTFAGLSICLSAFLDPGDEVIYISPPWFFYQLLIEGAGGKAVRVNADRTTFDLDLDAIEAAMTPRTRAVIVNSPNNPTGVVYSPETLRRLAGVLTAASDRAGRPVLLLSDEAYNRIVFDGATYPSPTEFYEHSLLLYTYGKTLLTPGERVGYVAVPRSMATEPEVMRALFLAQAITGWAFPNASVQHALKETEPLSIDIGRLEKRRDGMVAALRLAGYEVNPPAGTFYLLVRSPWPDDFAFCMALAERDVFVLPGRTFELPGWFRISITATDEMITNSLPVFEEMAQRPAPGPVAGV